MKGFVTGFILVVLVACTLGAELPRFLKENENPFQENAYPIQEANSQRHVGSHKRCLRKFIRCLLTPGPGKCKNHACALNKLIHTVLHARRAKVLIARY